MTHAPAGATQAPAVAHAGGVHAVAPAHAPAEREADRFAESFASADPGPAWSFGEVPVHAGDGARLGQGLEARLGAALDADLSSVRLHEDSDAADLSRRAGAEAVTIGHDISFAPGKHQPGSREGVRRLAHEVAHTARHANQGLAHRDGQAPVASASTLAGLPEADRKLIQVVTTLPVTPPDKDKLKSVFEATSITGPADSVQADASVPAAVSKGLINLAGEWSSGSKPPLVANSTFTVDLDLTSQGGSKGLFRFTYTSPAASAGSKGGAAKSRIVIEGLGKATAPAGTQKPAEPKQGETAPKDPVADKIKAASIGYSGYGTSQEPALRAAIAQVPASHLALVKGLKFARDTKHPTKPSVAGDYNPKTHTVTMYDGAFDSSAVVFDEAGVATSAAARYIVHEIGHAVDLAPLRDAWAAKEAADKAVNDAAGTFTSKEEKARYDTAVKAAGDADKALKAARSRSGTKTEEKKPAKGQKGPQPKEYEDVIGTDIKGVGFREAVKKDGKDVSKYAEDDWQESYAEAYSLFLTSRSALKALRPATYDYLDKNLPK